MLRQGLSVIIPTFNAMPRLVDCLSALVEGVAVGLVREAIVVDGASSDASASLAADMGCKVIVAPPSDRGRGNQLRHGGASATCDWLLFLHADTVLHRGWVAQVDLHIAGDANVAAYFTLAFDQDGTGPKRVALLANLRARVLGLPYGDQGLLISRALYDQIGGYTDIPLMEDVALVRRLGAKRLKPLAAKAVTSGAKFAHGGWWAVPSRNLMLLAAYLLGVSPNILSKWYK